EYDLGQDVVLINGAHDLFGDGSVNLIPTPGHTPGHQSLLVKTKQRQILLAGDACYLRRTLEEMRLPAIVHDTDQMLKSLQALKKLEAKGAEIFYGHDPEFWNTVPQVPARIL
ncbi:MAG: MBL fold metallo-hydrolase, partial [Gammaproteobacteria bacterium]|nr:MBL fold metallo-hydrolase [Gammaproteobacteria bacterium]